MKKHILIVELLALVGCGSEDPGSGRHGTGGSSYPNSNSGGSNALGDATKGGATKSGGASSTSGGANSQGGGATGGASNTCPFPSCLTALSATCNPTGTCVIEENPETGSRSVAYPNGVTQASELNLTDYSTALTVRNGNKTCFTTTYIGNDFLNGVGDLQLKDAAGAAVATVTMDETSSHYVITCTT